MREEVEEREGEGKGREDGTGRGERRGGEDEGR